VHRHVDFQDWVCKGAMISDFFFFSVVDPWDPRGRSTTAKYAAAAHVIQLGVFVNRFSFDGAVSE
jgi:hypothetical protein